MIADLLAAIPLPALLIAPDLMIRAANDAARASLGPDIVGGHIVRALRQPAVLEAVEACQTTGQRQSARHIGDDAGQETSFDVTCTAMDGGVLLCLTDITQMERTDRMRRDFVANVSHELRTPLTALSGFIETLRGPARGDVAATDRFLGIMQGEAARMERLVQDLLSLSRVEAEERKRPKTGVDLVAIVRSTLDLMRMPDGIELHRDLPEVPLMIPGDTDQLRQLCSNLLENAVKYGGQGGRIEIAVTAEDHHPALRGPAAVLAVRDHGPGIDPLHIPRLTERFYRIDTHRARQMGGTGLGLAIAKHIIARHRGRMSINSGLGQGAEFHVALPRF